MLRPRDSHDLRLLEATLTISPNANVRWLHDVFGNSIAIAKFTEPAKTLEITSNILIDRYPSSAGDYAVEPYARKIPFSYPASEIPDLGRTIERHYEDPDRIVTEWTREVLEQSDVDGQTEEFLIALTHRIKNEFQYNARYEPGVQTPVETIEKQAGTCRDFAVLMMEAVRSVGLASRFVSGYLYDPSIDGTHDQEVVGAGATHAWVHVYLPGAGWIEFDPTNGGTGGNNLVPISVAREPSQAMPVSGSFSGAANDFLGMTVDVAVHALNSAVAEK